MHTKSLTLSLLLSGLLATAPFAASYADEADARLKGAESEQKARDRGAEAETNRASEPSQRELDARAAAAERERAARQRGRDKEMQGRNRRPSMPSRPPMGGSRGR